MLSSTPPENVYKEYLDSTARYVQSTSPHDPHFKVNDGPIDNKLSEIGDTEFLLSDAKKCLVKLQSQFFHVFFDLYDLVMFEYEKDPNTNFVFDYSGDGYRHGGIESTYQFLFSKLDDMGIKYTILTCTPDSFYIVKNFYYKVNRDHSMFNVRRCIDMIRGFTNIEVKKPFRKIFLSRSKSPDHSPELLENMPESLPAYVDFVDDDRIDSTIKLEDYLKSKGFEIVYPEDFESFEDQLKFMSEVRVIASVTSSGLLNGMFMQDGQTMLEFQTPLISIQGDGSIHQAFHDFYHPIAYAMKHEYIAIPTMRSADLVIQRFESRDYLKALIEG